MMVFIQIPFDGPANPAQDTRKIEQPEFQIKTWTLRRRNFNSAPAFTERPSFGRFNDRFDRTCIRKALDMRGRRFTANREFQATLVTVLMALLIMLQLASH
jgi:hypothetical protein